VFGNSLVFIGVGCLDTQLPNGALISLKLFDSLPVEGYIYKDSVPCNTKPCNGLEALKTICWQVHNYFLSLGLLQLLELF